MDDDEAAVDASAGEHVRTCLYTGLRPQPNDCLACYLHRPAASRVRRDADHHP